MLKGLIFDFDGLLIDTEYAWYPIYKDYLYEKHSYTLLMEDFLICIGSGDNQLLDILQDEIGTAFDREHFHDFKYPKFIEATSQLPIKEGALDLLQEAKEQGLKIAIATSSRHPHAEKHLKRWGILDMFDVIITRDDVEFAKPEPDLFLKAVEVLDLHKDEVFIFEDSYNGLIAGNAAGIDTIIVPNEVTKHSTFETEFKKHDSLKELNLEILRGYKNENL